MIMKKWREHVDFNDFVVLLCQFFFFFSKYKFYPSLISFGVIVINNHNGFVLKSLFQINENYFIYFHYSPFPFLISLLSLLFFLFFFSPSSCHFPSSPFPTRHSHSLHQELHHNTIFCFKKLPKITHYQSQLISFIFFFISILDL